MNIKQVITASGCMFSIALAAAMLAQTPTQEAAPLRLPLWANGAPLGNGTFEKSSAAILAYLPNPAKANGLAMVICPGGAYKMKVMGAEGVGIAHWLNTKGIAGVVLDYRLPEGNYHRPLLDVQRAIRMVRNHAKAWHLNDRGIGIIGFSAGGHLASMAGTHFDQGHHLSPNPVERQSCRPDFMALIYPVVTMGPKTDFPSRKNLLGLMPSAKTTKLFSNEEHVTKDTPPTFLSHAVDDRVVSIDNSRMFLAALKVHQVPAELIEFPEGSHGFRGYKGPEWSAWQKYFLEWLSERYPLTHIH